MFSATCLWFTLPACLVCDDYAAELRQLSRVCVCVHTVSGAAAAQLLPAPSLYMEFAFDIYQEK